MTKLLEEIRILKQDLIKKLERDDYIPSYYLQLETKVKLLNEWELIVLEWIRR